MGKVKVFEIYYGRPRNVFHSGEAVTGSVVLETIGSVQAQNLSILMVGKGKVHWRSHSNDDKNHYRSEEYYINEIHVLLKPDEGSSKVTLPPGDHRYNFEFTLPESCPSSFEGTYGYVRYWCKAIFARPWKWDIETKKACTVLSHFDLNCEPFLSTPVRWDQSYNQSCCCVSQGDIIVALSVNKTGFVPGEPVLITGSVSNYTRHWIKAPKIKLEQSVDFYGFSDSMFSSGHAKPTNDTNIIKMQLVEGNEIPPNQTQAWNEKFVIPPLPPSGLKGAKYIDIKYLLKISISPKCDNRIKWHNAIIIGTVPILQQATSPATIPSDPDFDVVITQQPRIPSPMNSNILSEGDRMTDPSAPPSYSLFALPPPSYEECMSGNVHIREEGESEHMHGNLNFTPSYTYYRWNR